MSIRPVIRSRQAMEAHRHRLVIATICGALATAHGGLLRLFVLGVHPGYIVSWNPCNLLRAGTASLHCRVAFGMTVDRQGTFPAAATLETRIDLKPSTQSFG
jgi:hypothetical protein